MTKLTIEKKEKIASQKHKYLNRTFYINMPSNLLKYIFTIKLDKKYYNLFSSFEKIELTRFYNNLIDKKITPFNTNHIIYHSNYIGEYSNFKKINILKFSQFNYLKFDRSYDKIINDLWPLYNEKDFYKIRYKLNNIYKWRKYDLKRLENQVEIMKTLKKSDFYKYEFLEYENKTEFIKDKELIKIDNFLKKLDTVNKEIEKSKEEFINLNVNYFSNIDIFEKRYAPVLKLDSIINYFSNNKEQNLKQLILLNWNRFDNEEFKNKFELKIKELLKKDQKIFLKKIEENNSLKEMIWFYFDWRYFMYYLLFLNKYFHNSYIELEELFDDINYNKNIAIKNYINFYIIKNQTFASLSS